MLNEIEKIRIQNKINSYVVQCHENILNYEDMLSCENQEYWQARIKIERDIIKDLKSITI